MNAIVSHCVGLAVSNDDAFDPVVEFYSARFHCTIQSVNDRQIGLELARRSRPIVVLVDGNFLDEYLQDFVARLQVRWPALEIIIMGDGEAPHAAVQMNSVRFLEE